MQWKRKAGKYSTGESLFLGGKLVGSTTYALVARGDENVWAAFVTLPGPHGAPVGALGRYKTMEEAKGVTERAVKKWFEDVREEM